MLRFSSALSLGLLLLLRLLMQAASAPAIHAPLEGQALQGVVSVIGTTAVEGFVSAELSFAYLDNPTDTWFLIAQSDALVENDVLAQWDTTTISDGDYTLRLVVRLSDGGELSASVGGVRVRNYTAIEADTPTPTVPTPTPQASETLAPTMTPTITPAPSETPVPPTPSAPPPNPAELSRSTLLSSIGRGALAVVGLFALLGVYQGLRALFRRR
jgi:hypothetical protein